MTNTYHHGSVFFCSGHRRPPQPQPQRPPQLVVEAKAESSVHEPVQPRRPAPHRCRSNFATLHRTGAVPAKPSFVASELLPLRRHKSTATQSTIWPWAVQACTLQNIGFPGKKKNITAISGGHNTGNPKWYSSSLIRANLTCLLSWYSFHRRHYLTASSYTFFLILDVPSNSRCTRFLLIYYFTLARGPSPPGFQFLVS